MLRRCCTLFLLLLAATAWDAKAGPLVITDPGGAVLPETSLAALATAYAGGAVVIQVELVLTGDSRIVALPDLDLGPHTDVARRYPERSEADGSFPSTAFTYQELETISLLPPQGQAVSSETGKRPPALLPRFRIPTLADVVALLRLLGAAAETPPILFAEIKKSWRHLEQGLDLSGAITTELNRLGYPGAGEQLYLAAYDPEELQRLRDTLLPQAGLEALLIQLVDRPGGRETMRRELGIWQPYNYEWLLTKFGLKACSAYADGLGLPPNALVDSSGVLLRPDYVEDAHLLGLSIIAYPFDQAAEPLPGFSPDLDSLIRFYLESAAFDGLLTRFDHAARQVATELAEAAEAAREGPKNAIERLLEEVKKDRPRAPAADPDTPLQPQLR